MKSVISSGYAAVASACFVEIAKRVSFHVARKACVGALAIAAASALPAAQAAPYTPPTNDRVDFNFNQDWKFIKQDVTTASGASFDDSAWTPVSLPHTWNDDHYREWCSTVNSTKADPVRSSYYFGKAWYRKHFTIPTTYSTKKIILEFQGIGRMGKFWVNGNLVTNNPTGTHENGIGPAGLDITNYVNFGTDNVIAVRVDNNQNSKSEEYPGDVAWPYGVPFNVNFGGINRDVTLHIVNKVYQTFPLYRNLGTVGTYVYAKPDTIDTLAKTATLTVDSEVKNESGASASATIEAVVVDMAGNVAYTLPTSTTQSIPNNGKVTLSTQLNVSGVHFWSPDYPYLYKVYSILKVGGSVVDVQKIDFGFRKVTFGRTFGLQINGHPLYLNGYAPRSTMEWPAVGMPPDWLVDYDFDLIRQSHGNFLRPMHGAPRLAQVQAADRFGVIVAAPCVSTENDPAIVTTNDQTQWQMKKDIMRDVMIYFRNNPSVIFWEGCNGALSVQHEQEMLDLRLQWDPWGGRRSGSRSNAASTDTIREYSSTMDGSGQNKFSPLWDAEYARAEGPRRIWDVDSPMLNPRWDGVSSANGITNPAAGTVNNTTAKYLKGGYFYIASTYHQGLGLNTDAADAICDYLNPTNPGYFRLNSSEDMMLENVCKYWGRYIKSVYIQPPAVSDQQGIMVGGAKIIWADSDTDGRMKDCEVARTSGAVDGVRLPKETFYGMQVAQSSQPAVYIAGHWNYPTGTTRSKMYVVSNLPNVKLQVFNNTAGTGSPVAEYTNFNKNILPAGTFGDMVNNYAFQFSNVQWVSGSVKAIAYTSSPTEPGAVSTLVATAGAPAKLRITPIVGPSGQWKADGSDIAMFDVEVLDANNNRCPTWEDKVTFTWSGQGTFLGGYNSGRRYSNRLPEETGTSYNLNLECGVNRVFVRANRTAGAFTLNASATGLTSAVPVTINSAAFTSTNGLATAFPQTYDHAALIGSLTEPSAAAEAVPPPPPANAPNPADPGNFVEMIYTGGHAQQAAIVHNIQGGEQAYQDSSTITLPTTLPRYLLGADFIRAFKSDGGETTSTDQYQFDVNRFSYVYQVIDSANGMPNHNDNTKYNWVKLPETITVNGRSMKIYKSRLIQPYENVYLACNGHENDLSGFDSNLGFNTSSNMYMLFVVNAEQELQLPTNVVSATDSQGSNTPEKGIDGNFSTRWNAASGASLANPKVYNIDLGRNVLVGGYQIFWQNGATKYAQYKIEISPDGVSDWQTSLDMTANVNVGTDEYRVPANGEFGGRYLRITTYSVSGGGWPAWTELKVFGVLDAAPAANVPTVTSALTASGQGGYAFTYTITASGSPTGYQAYGLPSGWMLNGNTGVISGTTMQSGVIPITIAGVNTGGSGGAILNVTLAAPPPIPVVTTNSFSTQAGVAMTSTAGFYQITATNMSYTPKSYDADLPSGLGLAVSSSTGKITGTPKWPGTYDIPIYATNPGGTGTGTVHFTVTPNGPAPVISSAATVNLTAFVAMTTYTITASNSPTLFDAAPLPAGLSRSTSAGTITGTPTAPGTYVVTVSATGIGGTGTKQVTFNVAPNPNAPNITASSFTINGNVGVAITPVTIATSPAATSFAVSPALPAGLTFNTTTGVISGTPTATVSNGSYTITASNSVGSDTAPLTINIGAAITPPVISGPLNGVGAVGSAIKPLQFTSTNSPTFSATGLPGGLSINSTTGAVSGTPTATGTFNATITATNSSGSDTHDVTIVISAAGSDINLALNCATLTSTDHTTNYTGPKAVDGVNSTTSRWESDYSDPQWIEIDLGSSRQINQVRIYWQNAAGKDYRIETSPTSGGVSGTGGTWTNFVTPIVGNNTANAWLSYTGSVTARYLRIYGTARKTQYGYSPQEIEVLGPASGGGGGNPPSITSSLTANATAGSSFSYTITATNSPTSYGATNLSGTGLSVNTTTGVISGTPSAAGTITSSISATNSFGSDTETLVITVASSGTDTNVAAGITPTVTSSEGANTADKISDGLSNTRWAASSAAYPQVITFDLGSNKVLSKVEVDWYGAATRAYKYKIETSTDGTNYDLQVDNTGNTTFGNTSDTVSVTARYVKISVTGSTAGWASAYELRILGH